MEEKKLIVTFSVLAIFFLAISMGIVYLEMNRPSLDPGLFEGMTTGEIIDYFEGFQAARVPLYFLIPIAAFAGLLIGTFTYRSLSGRVAVKEKQLKGTTETVLKLLGPEEKLAVRKIFEEGGKVGQFEITRLPGMSKVKTHRTLRRLEQRGIIRKEKLGKVNVIRLDEGILQVLREGD